MPVPRTRRARRRRPRARRRVAVTETLVEISARPVARSRRWPTFRDAPFAPLAAHGLEDERLTALEKLHRGSAAAGPSSRACPGARDAHRRIAVPRVLSTHSSCSPSIARDGRRRRWRRSAGPAISWRDELGLEPGPELRELERAILRAGTRSSGHVKRRRGRARPATRGRQVRPSNRVKHPQPAGAGRGSGQRWRPRASAWHSRSAVAVLRSDQTHATELSKQRGRTGRQRRQHRAPPRPARPAGRRRRGRRLGVGDEPGRRTPSIGSTHVLRRLRTGSRLVPARTRSRRPAGTSGSQIPWAIRSHASTWPTIG